MKRQIAFAVGAMVAAGGLGYAQQESNCDSPQHSQKQAKQQQQQWSSSAQQVGSWVRLQRLDPVIGADIRDSQGRDIGDIEDVFLDLENARAVGAAIDFDEDYLDTQGRLVHVTFETLVIQPAGKDLRVTQSMERDELLTAPSFDENYWPNDPMFIDQPIDRPSTSKYFRDDTDYPGTTGNRGGGAAGDPNMVGQYAGRIDRRARADLGTNYPGTTGNRLGEAAGDPNMVGQYAGRIDQRARADLGTNYPGTTGNRLGEAAGEPNVVGRYAEYYSTDRLILVRASDLIGAEVENNRGTDLARVEDVLVERPGGRIAFLVLALEGFMGMGERLHPVPFEAFTVRRAGDDEVLLVLNVDADRLRQAPAFDDDHWPSSADLSWTREVHAYYNVSESESMARAELKSESKSGWTYAYTPAGDTRDQPAPDWSSVSRSTSAATDANAAIAGWPQAAQKAARDMIQKYGQPDGVTDVALVWMDQGPWKRIVVFREEIPHNFPVRHVDVLAQTISYKVPVDMIDDLSRFDGSITVDRTAGCMTARCQSEAANFLALNLAHDICTGKRTVEDARQFMARTFNEMMQGQSSPQTQSLIFQTSGSGTSSSSADPDSPSNQSGKMNR
ncbi:MAG: PRC-barrel domain-containing protein [Phycisphaerales bacterium]|nr:PRC-barrel domain-containing protein [Phycisphaerales bacterium]